MAKREKIQRTAKVIGDIKIFDQLHPNQPAKLRKTEEWKPKAGKKTKRAEKSHKKSASGKKAAGKKKSAQPTKRREKKAAAKAVEETAPATSKSVKGSQLDQLKKMTTVVIDTGDFNLIKDFKPTDATTNPSLLLAACKMPEYDNLIKEAIEYGLKSCRKNSKGGEQELITTICDKLAVIFGTKILDIVPGYVSTEVDARLSFDTEATIHKAQKIIQMYDEVGVKKDRILIKIASTWEGIEAARRLQRQGISCNLTLLFNFYQAVACAQAGVTLISPFVGRILDWYKASTGKDYKPEEEPGVHSVTRIYNYFKKYNHKTYVMGASFRNKGEIINLAGCDRLTIAPKLLEELSSSTEKVTKLLDKTKAKKEFKEKAVTVLEPLFRWEMNQDAMATEKLSEGIRKFSEDLVALEDIIKLRLAEYLNAKPSKKSKKSK